MFDLTYNGNDLQCPKCAATLSVENWYTEYGEPQDGQYTERYTKCPSCGYQMTIEVKTNTRYTAR